MASYRKELFGVELGEKIERSGDFKIKGSQWEIDNLMNHREARKITKLDGKVEVIAEFEGGLPAITRNTYGKGQALYFASQPFNKNAIADSNWKKFTKKLHASLGGKLGHKIWRFKLPDKYFPQDILQINEVKDSFCLTGNFGFWDRFVFTPGERYNVQTRGEYIVKSDKGTETFDFANGPLTNRLAVLTAPLAPGRQKYSSEFLRKFDKKKWVQEFKKGEKKKITFDFKKPCSLKLLRVFYSNKSPDMRIEISKDGKEWIRAAETASLATKDPRDVLYKDFDLSGKPEARFLRIVTNGEFDGSATIVEIEVWGNQALLSASR
jgi:hypothetical protein